MQDVWEDVYIEGEASGSVCGRSQGEGGGHVPEQRGDSEGGAICQGIRTDGLEMDSRGEGRVVCGTEPSGGTGDGHDAGYYRDG
jgi:hypothetical protein